MATHHLQKTSIAFACLSLSLFLVISCTPALSLKHAHLRYYLQDSLNYTDFIILRGLQGVDTPVSSPFGTLFCYNDPITQGPERTSAVVGSYVGNSIAASFDGLTFFTSSTLTFNTTDYQGSLSVLGAVGTLGSTGIPVVGGTKDFLYAVGSVVMNPVNVSTFNITYSIDIDLSWPPYAHV